MAQMSVADTSLLRYGYHHSSCFIYNLFYVRYLIEYVFIVSLFSLQNVYVYDYVSVISFHSHINMDHVFQRLYLLHIHRETMGSVTKSTMTKHNIGSGWNPIILPSFYFDMPMQ